MKDKNLLPDNNTSTLEELTDQANQIIESLENEKDLNNSVESYQQLLNLLFLLILQVSYHYYQVVNFYLSYNNNY